MRAHTTNPNSDAILPGQLRNLGMGLAAFLAALGYFKGLDGYIAPVIIAALLLAYSIWMKSGWRRITTLIRKLIAASAGLGIAAGVVGASQFQAFENLSSVVLPLVWSILEKKASPAHVVRLALLGFWVAIPCLLISCGTPLAGAVDVMVDKSKKKGGTMTHDLYPASAVTPILNSEPLNIFIQKGVDKVNDKLPRITPTDAK